ncbi:ROK family transcriptional regulator [Frigoribacterium sp. PvP032]|uniref:ROK family transcriptional regulator n=1 Tax=Frigoribacterium sp. PvP032 TaxID=2806589 RepID=UPI001AE70F04|nr:ROK family transcriptional regulator [Frigoribacterium sp. PvP032]MBP1189473.1 putative NBD/HSP70 family sugar kinase [Frigoribacterium sp. PvP032]
MTTTEPVLGESGRELVREVLIHGPIARAELGRRLGLSPASLTRLSKPFLDRGLFVEGAVELAGAVGRPAKPLDVRVDLQCFVGIKLTGDQALGVLTDLRAKTLGEHVADLAGHSPEEVVEALAAVVEALAGSGGDGRAVGGGVSAEADPSRDGSTEASVAGAGAGGVAELAGVGVSIGGKVTGQQVVLRAPFLEWREVDLGGMLSRRLGLPVVVENDVVALTEAERWFGLGRGIDDFAVVTTGAGVGYGLVIHGRQVITPDTGLGLGGHFPLDPTGPICADGHRGCSTAMLSTTSMCASAAVGLGRLVSYEELLALAASGNAVAVQVVGTAGRSLGRMIAAVANLTMVGTVVLSGEGIGLVDVPVAASEMRAGIAADRDPDASEVRVLTGDADFGAWARGAAAVAVQARIGALGA